MSEIARRVEVPPLVPQSPLSRMARMDRNATRQARADYQNARLAQHRAELETIVEKAKARMRATLAMDAMAKAREVSDCAATMAQGRESLAMTLGEMMQGYVAGETARLIRRGYED